MWVHLKPEFSSAGLSKDNYLDFLLLMSISPKIDVNWFSFILETQTQKAQSTVAMHAINSFGLFTFII